MIARGRLPYAALAIGVLAVSWSAILVREAAAPALVIGAYRMIFAGLPVGAWAVLQRHREPEPLSRATFAPLLLSAVFLTAHFAFWIASVQQTSVITSVVLVAAQPLYVALLSPVMLGERVERHVWLAILVASAGALTMAAEDVTDGLGTVVGDGYAVLGGLFAALYIMVGRRVRPTVSWPRYVGTVYPLTALLLLALTLIAREPLAAHSNYSWAMIALLALGPQLVGHNAINWSLAYLPAVLVSVAILGEPVGATAWAAIVLDEHPSIAELAGAPLVLLGVALALRPGRRQRIANGLADASG
jgi:drug/metabolite transporter (DMT)-like permease